MFCIIFLNFNYIILFSAIFFLDFG